MGKISPFKALMADDASYKDKSVQLMMLTDSGSYRLDETSRPNIYHDNGHLDKHSRKVFGIGPGKFAPHPVTENWVKPLGQHVFWVSATVIVSVSREPKIGMDAELLIPAEDKYNFNPGDSDIATGIPDSANGRFEVFGLANQYLNYGEIRRMISWTKGVTDSGMVEGASSKVPDAPSDSRYGD